VKNINRFIFSAGTLAFLCAFSRADFVIQFDSMVTGTTPGGTPPWATLSIQDAGADTVNFTFTHSATSSPGQFISTLWLNMEPFPSNPQMIENSATITGADFDHNNVSNAGYDFDLKVNFETSNGGGNRLDPGENVSWQFTGTGLNSSAFNNVSGGNGQVLAMAHMQGLANGQSGKMGASIVPEPTTIGALAMGALALLRRRRK
jgi:hypothetical protein